MATNYLSIILLTRGLVEKKTMDQNTLDTMQRTYDGLTDEDKERYLSYLRVRLAPHASYVAPIAAISAVALPVMDACLNSVNSFARVATLATVGFFAGGVGTKMVRHCLQLQPEAEAVHERECLKKIIGHLRLELTVHERVRLAC